MQLAPISRKQQVTAILISSGLFLCCALILNNAKQRYEVIRETSTRTVTQATVTDHRSVGRGSRLSEKYTVSYSTENGEQISAKFIVPPMHSRRALFDSRIGESISVAYLPARPESSTYLSQYTGSGEYWQSVLIETAFLKIPYLLIGYIIFSALTVWLLVRLFRPSTTSLPRSRQLILPAVTTLCLAAIFFLT